MTNSPNQHQQIVELIHKATEQGWDRTRLGWKSDANLWFMAHAYTTPNTHIASVNDLLFGDNLSFLAALPTDAQLIGFTKDSIAYIEAHPDYFAAARQKWAKRSARSLVTKDDDKRIPWLFDQIFKWYSFEEVFGEDQP